MKNSNKDKFLAGEPFRIKETRFLNGKGTYFFDSDTIYALTIGRPYLAARGFVKQKESNETLEYMYLGIGVHNTQYLKYDDMIFVYEDSKADGAFVRKFIYG